MGVLGGVRILIVEDDDDNRFLLEESLRFQGAGVQAVGTATEAVEVLGCFDIVVADYELPDHDGVWLLEHAMRLSPPVPVILVSGYAQSQVDAIAKAPFACKLLKPVDALDVGVEVIKALSPQRTREIGGGSAPSPWTLFFDRRIARRAARDQAAHDECRAASVEVFVWSAAVRARSRSVRAERPLRNETRPPQHAGV